MRCKILILLTALVMTVGFGVSVASAQIWKVDFQGDENHNSTYGQNGPRYYTEPGVYWNIFEVAGFSAVGATNVSTPPTSMNLLDTEGNDQGVTLTILTDAWGWANEGTLDDLWGDYLIILNAQGATSDPTDWEITGLSPNTLCELTYYHRANIDGRGLNFIVNGVETTVISTSDGYMATASVKTDASGKITGTADSDGYSEGCWAGLVIAIIPTARNPQPADGAIHPDTWASLGWTPGAFAGSHDVYFGENFDDVNDGVGDTFRGNQTSTFFVAGFSGFAYPEGLVPGTTYYWRIDEVNDADPNSPWKGDVWSFSIPPKTAYNPNPADGAESIGVDVTLNWTEGFGAKLHTVYFGDNFDEVNNAAGGLPQGTATYNPGPLKLAKTYYWRIDEFDAIATYKGDVWSFTTQGAVESLSPSNGAVDVKQTQILTWSPGVYSASHQVYFGDDKEAVKNADTSSPEYKGSGDLGSESYDPGQLEWNTTYYWRVDEANNTNPDSPWVGNIWSFTTANFLIVDDFESYNDLDPADPDSNRIFNAWLDGYDDPANGSLVGYDNPPFAEQTIVHGGNQSLPLYYDNSVGYSEATLTLTYPRDWNENGVDTLTIWFRGDSDNAAETLYVALNGSAVVSHDNPDAAQIGIWTEWTIDLQAFADQGVNLANVNTIALGLGNKNNPLAGGSGTKYFDDIRLYRPAP
ncbi:MAG TPA: hypothetical protein VMW72_26260 [Sedimentisphaerales bacterium]|nr:hypothetical protein [Sedimentisphaerales bacterium]